MRIRGADVRRITVGLNEHKHLSAKMLLTHGDFQFREWELILTNPIDAKRLSMLLEITGARNIDELIRKKFYTVYQGSSLKAFAGIEKDNFILTFGQELKVVSEVELEKMLETN